MLGRKRALVRRRQRGSSLRLAGKFGGLQLVDTRQSQFESACTRSAHEENDTMRTRQIRITGRQSDYSVVCRRSNGGEREGVDYSTWVRLKTKGRVALLGFGNVDALSCLGTW